MGPIKRHEFKGTLMTASEIARGCGLSLPTVMRRLRAGLKDDDLTAPAYGIVYEAPPPKASERQLSVSEARYRLKRAIAAQERRDLSYRNAMLDHEPAGVLARLRLARDKATISVMYWHERLSMARKAVDPEAGLKEKLRARKVPGRRGWVGEDISPPTK